jgi:uncharacterized protein
MDSSFFQHIKTIAIIGLSDKPERYSYQVGAYLKSKGFTIIPINPNIKESLGEQSYPDLLSVPKSIHIDLVDIFRRSEEVVPHVKETVERSDAKIVWMQEGVMNTEAEAYGKAHGLEVIMNMCLMIAHKQIDK